MTFKRFKICTLATAAAALAALAWGLVVANAEIVREAREGR